MGSIIPVVFVRDISSSRFQWKSNTYVTGEKAKLLKAHSAQPKDVLITKMGTPPGISAQYPAWMPNGVITADIIRIRVDEGLVSPAFLVDCLNSSYVAEQVYERTAGQTRPKLTLSDYKTIKIDIPPIEEQRKIAAILGDWDQAIGKLEQLLAAKRTYKRGLMQHLLTGKMRFPEFSDEWQEAELGTLFVEVANKVGDQNLTPYSISAGIGFVSQREKWGKDIAGNQYTNYTHLKKGEFSYNKGNSKKYPCGCAYLLKDQEEIAVPNVFISFRPKTSDVCVEFYEQYFIANYHAKELPKYISSGARSDGLLNLSKNDFFKITVPTPSFKEQRRIAGVLAAADAEIAALERQLEAFRQQKRGLMQQLLTGKTRVKVEG